MYSQSSVPNGHELSIAADRGGSCVLPSGFADRAQAPYDPVRSGGDTTRCRRHGPAQASWSKVGVIAGRVGDFSRARESVAIPWEEETLEKRLRCERSFGRHALG